MNNALSVKKLFLDCHRPIANEKMKKLAVILFMLSAFAFSVEGQTFLTNGLVAYYPLNGNANDSSGNGYNGTATGVTYVTNRYGITNGAASFAGNSGSLISITTSNFNLPTNFTVSAWVNFTANSGSFSPRIFSTSGYEIGTQTTSANRNAFIDEVGGSSVNSSNVLNAGTWYQIVGVCQSNQMYLYVNGVIEGSVALTRSLTYSAGVYPKIAENTTDGLDNFGGSISDVRLYNLALTASQVSQLYAYETPPCIPHNAVATATVVNGFVVGAVLTDGGCGYSNAPVVLIQGGGGSGATATAQISGSEVTNLVITSAGAGYTNVPNIYFYIPTVITNQPRSLLVNAYQSATFSVGVTGTTPFSYQWMLNNTNIPGATGSTLTIASVTQTNLGAYSVLITNVFGSTLSSNATLSMNPYLVSPFTGEVAYWGTNVLLNIVAWGTGPLTYQWFENGSAIGGATNASYDIANAQLTNSGLYSVVVTSPLGSVTNTPEQLIVEPAGVTIGFSPALTIRGVAGYTYIIQSTTNLDSSNWVTLTNLTLTQNVQVWVDTSIDASSPFYSKYFYRLLPQQ